MDIILLLSQITWVVLQIVFFLILFILILLLVILFTNLKYQFKTNTMSYSSENKIDRKGLDFNLKVTYLFSGLKIFANKKDDKIKILIKLFGFSVFKNIVYNSLADNYIYDNPKEEGANSNEEKGEEEKQPIKEKNEEETFKKEQNSFEYSKENREESKKEKDVKETRHDSKN